MNATWRRSALIAVVSAAPAISCAPSLPRGTAAALDLVELARAGKLRAGNRQVGELTDGARRGVRVSAGPGDDVVWLDGLELGTGTIGLEVRGKDVLQQSFVGVAFSGLDDRTYEAVYLRPFNFRSTDPVRKVHAVQYVFHPSHPWPRLRSEQPEVYENPVEPAPDPNDWVPLRVVVEPTRVSVYVSEGPEADLVVNRLADGSGRRLGLWVGNGSDGDFANLRITSSGR